MEYLSLIQITVAILLIITILLQQRGTALGSAFGGAGGGIDYFSRRGLEKKLFWASAILGALFIALALVNLLL